MTNEEAIEDVVNRFNFEKVYAAMKAVGWTWFDSPGTPSLLRMQSAAREHLADVLDGRGVAVSGSGGFEAYRDGEEVGLRFVLAEVSAYREK